MLRRSYQMEQSPDEGSAQGAGPAQDPNAELMDRLAKLETAYSASSREAQRLNQELQQVRGAQQQAQDPFTKLQQDGWPVETLAAWVDQLADKKVNDRFTPLIKGLEARGQVMQENPDFGKFESETMRFIGEDAARQSRYNSLMQVDPAAAMDWAYTKYESTQRKAQPASNGGGNKAARADASIPSGQSNSNRNANADSGMAEVAKKAINEFQKTGDKRAAERYGQARLRSVIPDSFFER